MTEPRTCTVCEDDVLPGVDRSLGLCGKCLASYETLDSWALREVIAWAAERARAAVHANRDWRDD